MLFETYANLVRDFPNGCDQLFGQNLSQNSSLWLSVDRGAHPSLLFAAQRNEHRSDIELRSVSVHFSRDCMVEAAGGVVASGIYTVVRLNENDPEIVRILLRLLEEAFPDREKLYTNKDISGCILELADLLKKIDDSPRDIVGLWGELYVLSRSVDLDTAVKCWCRDNKARYDFITDSFALEAKTTLRNKRKHRFSLDQLRPKGEFRVYIASLTVVELSSGKTAADLMDELYGEIVDGDLRAHFLMQCLIKGGREIYRNTLKLGVFPNRTSLIIFNACDIPVPEIAPAMPIENVRFDVDLTGLAPVPLSEMDAVLAFGMGR